MKILCIGFILGFFVGVFFMLAVALSGEQDELDPEEIKKEHEEMENIVK